MLGTGKGRAKAEQGLGYGMVWSTLPLPLPYPSLPVPSTHATEFVHNYGLLYLIQGLVRVRAYMGRAGQGLVSGPLFLAQRRKESGQQPILFLCTRNFNCGRSVSNTYVTLSVIVTVRSDGLA